MSTPPFFLSAAAEDKESNDNNPNDVVIVKEIAKTVVHGLPPKIMPSMGISHLTIII